MRAHRQPRAPLARWTLRSHARPPLRGPAGAGRCRRRPARAIAFCVPSMRRPRWPLPTRRRRGSRCATARSTARPTGALAQAEDAAGHADRATALYATAVARWPRDRIARATLADRAFAADDVDGGLHHIDALLRVAPAVRATVLGKLMPYLGDPRIRDGLVARLAADPPWRGAVAAGPAGGHRTGGRRRSPARRVGRTPRAHAGGTAGPPAAARPPGPAGQGAVDLARHAVPADRAVAGLVFDGGFERPGVVAVTPGS